MMNFSADEFLEYFVVENRFVTADQISQAKAQAGNQSLGYVLHNMGFLSKKNLDFIVGLYEQQMTEFDEADELQVNIYNKITEIKTFAASGKLEDAESKYEEIKAVKGLPADVHDRFVQIASLQVLKAQTTKEELEKK